MSGERVFELFDGLYEAYIDRQHEADRIVRNKDEVRLQIAILASAQCVVDAIHDLTSQLKEMQFAHDTDIWVDISRLPQAVIDTLAEDEMTNEEVLQDLLDESGGWL